MVCAGWAVPSRTAVPARSTSHARSRVGTGAWMAPDPGTVDDGTRRRDGARALVRHFDRETVGTLADVVRHRIAAIDADRGVGNPWMPYSVSTDPSESRSSSSRR